MLRLGDPSPGGEGPDAIEVVRDAYPRLLHLARRLAATPGDAEDLVQEAFVETLSRYPGFAGLERPAGYLATVLYRAAYRRWRRSAVEVPSELQERLEEVQPDLDAAAMIPVALSGLGPKQRACLVLRYLYDLNDEEIGEALGCRASTVRSQLARALRNARERIGDDSA
jgi:RNA polymerase sigma factor (sigma-70 family)